ncbi:MAG: hypothetical protein HQM11_12120 [SAR324 cluster bacterium]|nr:hypothetical protein [SAR324 cluster bacterium]
MKILLWGLFLICFALFSHLLIWKIRLPVRQTRALLAIFFGTFLSGLIINYVLVHTNNTALIPYLLSSLPEYLEVFLFGTALTLSYVITYSALEADSPTIVMIFAIYKSGSEGIEKSKFEQIMNDEILIDSRIADLVRDKMVHIQGGRYQLTPKGKRFAQLFTLIRKLMNTYMGG